MDPLQGERLLFLSHQSNLERSGGGVQWCTQEFLQTFHAAGFEVIEHAYETDRSLKSRVRRKLRPRPFEGIVPPRTAEKVARSIVEHHVRWIALNSTDACVLAAPLRALVPDCRLLFLSHGAEITDELNGLRLDPATVPPHRRTARWFGQSLLDQIDQRKATDATLCISAEDELFEYWLGAKNAIFLPRRVPSNKLILRPLPGRVGTVATLNHVPNRHGIEQLAHSLNGTGVRFRIVGGPHAIGQALAAKYSCIDYCGRLSDADLAQEAATWNAFVNPLFCQARGASTKVATALGWGLPVLSTRQGVRGYVWDCDTLPISSSPMELARLAHHLAVEADPCEWHHRAQLVASLAPSLADTADQLGSFLLSLP